MNIPMNRAPLLLLMLLAACAPQPNEREETTARVRAEHAKMRETMREHDAKRQLKSDLEADARKALLEQLEQDRMRAYEATKAERHQTQEDERKAECDRTRPERLAEQAAYDAAYAKKVEFVEWEDTHCKWHDRSVPVVRLMQDSRGEYHMMERRSTGITRECDAKEPAKFKGMRREDYIAQPTHAVGCEKFDEQAKGEAGL